MNKENLLALVATALCFTSCAVTTAQKAVNQTSNNVNQAKSEVSNSIQTQANQVQQQQQTSLVSSCAKNIKGLKKAVTIPERLCFNSSLPVDKSQILPAQRAKTDDPNVVEERDVEYAKLSAEVREVIELTVGDIYKGQKLHLLVLRTGDEVTNKAVKSYRYFSPDGEGVSRINDWTFNVQGGKQKLESAEINETDK